MWPRIVAPLVFLVALTLALSIPVQAGIGNCGTTGKCPTLIPPPSPSPTATPITSSPIPSATSGPSATPAPSPTVAPTASGLSFDDEFSGTTLNPVWIRHFSCCGTLAGYDPTLATVSGGYLHLSVVDRSTGFWGYLLDTKTTFTQRYGHFEARMQIPKGPGLWPAFWMYLSGTPEIDTVEVCANPLGANNGNDASLLHQTLHYGTGSTIAFPTRTVDLSLAFHTYGVDWRAGRVSFYLDGVLTGTTTNVAAIPTGALPLIVNLGAGGSWCGAAASGGTLLVDWIRATT